MEKGLTEKNGLYALPLQQKPELKLSLHILYGVVITVFLGFAVMAGVLPNIGNEKFFLITILAGMSGFAAYIWVGAGVLHKPYLTVTEEELKFTTLFGQKTVPLKSIYKAEFYVDHSIVGLGIWAEQKGKRSFIEVTDRFFGRDYSVGIPVPMFRNVDFEKLRLTILSRAMPATDLTESAEGLES